MLNLIRAELEYKQLTSKGHGAGSRPQSLKVQENNNTLQLPLGSVKDKSQKNVPTPCSLDQ